MRNQALEALGQYMVSITSEFRTINNWLPKQIGSILSAPHGNTRKAHSIRVGIQTRKWKLLIEQSRKDPEILCRHADFTRP
jgi:hypothetical protein